MCVSLLVHVGHPADELLEDTPAKVFVKPLIRLLLDVVVYALAHAQFHYEVDVGSLVYDLVQFHNVWVPQIRQGVDLPVHGHLGLLVLEVLLVVGLDGNHMLGVFVLGSSDDGKGSCSYLKVDLEVSQIERLLIWVLLPSLIDDTPERLQSRQLKFLLLLPSLLLGGIGPLHVLPHEVLVLGCLLLNGRRHD